MEASARLETFSDGVFVIAATLLILEIRVDDGAADLPAALLDLWPSYAAYASSFLTIGIMRTAPGESTSARPPVELAGMRGSLSRLRRTLRRYGPAGFLRRAVGLARERAYDRRTHVWYQLLLDVPHRSRPLPAGLTLIEGSESKASILDELWAIDRGELRSRLASGGRLWIVVAGEAAAFSCWTFSGRTPVRASTGGWLALPADTACLEESMTAAAFRGRGVAPAAWAEIVARLKGEPAALRRLVTTVEEENVASRKAVEKVGFREIGRVHTSRIALRSRVSIEVGATGTDTEFLQALRSG